MTEMKSKCETFESLLSKNKVWNFKRFELTTNVTAAKNKVKVKEEN